MTTAERLFDPSITLDEPIAIITVCIIIAALVFTPAITLILQSLNRISETLSHEILIRTRSWAIISLLVIGPILLGAAWAIAMVYAIAIFCYIEYARMTGLFRDRLVSWSVLIGITLIHFAVLDHWYGLFVALGPLVMLLIAITSILNDKPKGYVQRVALATFGFFLFGVCLGHMAYLANSPLFRSLMLILLLGVALNDIYAFIFGKLFGNRKLCPNTSPNKTIAGSLGAIIATTATVLALGLLVLPHAQTMRWPHLILGGIMISICGQLGDLMLSSIKRDVGVKDTGKIIPGHGGLLDRVDSLLLTAPAVFHFIGYFEGIGLDMPTHIITGN